MLKKSGFYPLTLPRIAHNAQHIAEVAAPNTLSNEQLAAKIAIIFKRR